MGTKNFSNANDLITFSRASAGTALRKIAYGSELVTNGDDFSSGWTTAGWTISSEQASVTANGTNQNLYGTPVSNAVAGKLYQLSYEVISSSVAAGNLRAGAYSGASFFGGSYFTLNTTVGTHVVNFVGSPSGSGSVLDFWLYAGATSGTLVIDNISVKEVLFDQPDGTLTLFNHPADIPRIEYDADGNVLGLLVEEQRTNLLTYSEDFSNASWAAFGTKTITQAAGISPDNSLTATYLASPGNNGMQSTITVSASTAYMFSVFAKADVSSSLRVSYATIGGTTANGVFDFEISTGVDVGNGWYRCSVTFTTDVGNTSAVIRIQSGVVSQGIYIWGAQFEAGAFPTSYIPTSGSTATRAADVASIPVSAFGYNQSKGTVVIDVASINGFTFGSIGDGTFENDLRLGASGANTVRGTGSGFAKSVTNGSYNYETGKIAIAIEEDNYYTAKNGIGAAGVDTSASLPPNPQRLNIGSDYTNFQNGHIKSIKYYPRRLTNAQIVELTS